MESCVVLNNPVMLTLIIVNLFLWLFALGKKSILLPCLSYLIYISITLYGDLHGAPLEELLTVTLIYILPAVIKYDGSGEETL